MLAHEDNAQRNVGKPAFGIADGRGNINRLTLTLRGHHRQLLTLMGDRAVQ
jgi:hypothetical protein